MLRFSIKSLGCKVNQCESEDIADALKKAGMEETSPVACRQNSDICIINTCTVTQKASMQSRQAIRQAIRANPEARIIVTGCYAATEPDEIKRINGVHSIIANSRKNKIPEIILSDSELKSHFTESDHQKKIEHDNQVLLPQPDSRKRTRPFLKIQDGCNAFCTYCIVPYARGRSRSMPPDQVLEKINKFSKKGFHEVVLTGIHLGVFGLDLKPASSLSELLEKIEKAKPECRIRLSSIEPRELTGSIIKLVEQSNVFCRHFHIPLQSGDNCILKKMNRPYDRELFRKLVLKIHKSIPGAAIGVDILAGFPGETEEAFYNTYFLIKELSVTYLHVFPFSPRKGTPAAGYQDQVSPQTLKLRTGMLRELGALKKKEFYSGFIGQKVKIIIEGKRTKNGELKGLTSNYIPVHVNGGDDLKNSIVEARIVQLKNNSTTGRIISRV
ncbi:MAG: tRNA (N(6)-L-threonylcarbamoyladenosine(37)-C(2))-methylthiotransferase MtaB [Deltaproteobacteria bacterium]|nr:tRNA (N(6)-L-threonylcarbamoyladenosine(37)-C(2))-methylthiotransferase MtaB [Deltaproteobacteria bacterium]